MSSAFDTIYRDQLINIAEEILGEDEVRIIRGALSIAGPRHWPWPPPK